jgi:uncharacterized membrane protein YccC
VFQHIRVRPRSGHRRRVDWLLAWSAVASGTPAWGRGLRLATAMIVPLAAGVIGGQPTTGLLIGVGGFVVASTDTGAPYRTRATTMIAATLGVTTAFFLGAVTAAPRWLSVLLFVAVLVGSALTGTVGPRVALVSTMITVAFIIGAFLPSSLAADAAAALALLAGGGWALVLSLGGWTFDQRGPERRAVSAAINSCAAFLGDLAPAGDGVARPDPGGDVRPPGSGAREAARQSLAAARQTLQAALPRNVPQMSPEVRWLWTLLYATGTVFDAIVAARQQLQTVGPPGPRAVSDELAPAITAMRAAVGDAAAAVGTGRRRARAKLLARLTPWGASASARPEGLDHDPGSRQAVAPSAAALTVLRRLDEAVRALTAAVTGCGADPGWLPPAVRGHVWPGVIRALRQPSAAVLRGSARQAVAGGIALVVASAFDPAHGAWLVSSTVLVLKPNVSGTFSTAAQRAAATVIGAAIAAGIVAVTADQATLIALSFAAAALAMAVMPLSYSLGMLVITPLSILLTAVLTGSGWLIAVSRVENILIGVAIAVVVSYLLFPAWLRTSVPGLVAGTIDAIGRYLALLREPARARDDLLHRARSEAETAVASLRVTAGQLGLEPGSSALAIAGDVSAAAGRVLDSIITLKQVLDQTGPEQSAGPAIAIIGEASDALSRMRAAVAGQEPPAPVPVLASNRHPQSRADGLTTGAAMTQVAAADESSRCARVRPPLLSAALDQLTEAIASLRRVLGGFPPWARCANQDYFAEHRW